MILQDRTTHLLCLFMCRITSSLALNQQRRCSRSSFFQFIFSRRYVQTREIFSKIEMAQTVTYLLMGFLLIGATGKLINGPWLINRLFPTTKPTRASGNSLSPVIFGEALFLRNFFALISRDDFKVQVIIALM